MSIFINIEDKKELENVYCLLLLDIKRKTGGRIRNYTSFTESILLQVSLTIKRASKVNSSDNTFNFYRTEKSIYYI